MKNSKFTTMLVVLLLLLDLLSVFLLKNYYLSTLFTVLLVVYWIYISKPFRLMQKANALFKDKQYEEAFALFDQATALKNCPKLIHITAIYKRLSRGELETATTLLSGLNPDTLSEEEKVNYDAVSALITWKKGNLEEAISIFENLLSKKESSFGYEILGMLLNSKKDYEKALEVNEKAYELFPNSAMIKDNLATSYYYSEYDYLDEVKKLCKELITNEVGFPDPYFTYALLMEELEKFKAARKYLKLALKKEFFYLSDLNKERVTKRLELIEDKIKEKENALTSEDSETK